MVADVRECSVGERELSARRCAYPGAHQNLGARIQKYLLLGSLRLFGCQCFWVGMPCERVVHYLLHWLVLQLLLL